MIHKEGPQFLNSPRHGAPHAALLNRRALLAGPGLDMRDGTIEVELAGAPLPGAPGGARGFAGLAFRIDEAGGGFPCEGIYLRPTNGRADDQVRRNHATQYFSYPGYDFDRLRREAPARYESYVDVVPAQWIRIRVELSGSRAELLELWERGWVCLLKTLKSLKAEDLVKTVLIRGEPHSVPLALERSLGHTCYHIGQIVQVARIHAGEKWNTLTIPRGGSEQFNKSSWGQTGKSHS